MGFTINYFIIILFPCSWQAGPRNKAHVKMGHNLHINLPCSKQALITAAGSEPVESVAVGQSISIHANSTEAPSSP